MNQEQINHEVDCLTNGENPRLTILRPNRIVKESGHGQIHDREEIRRIANFMSPIAQRDHPKWDGVHGR